MNLEFLGKIPWFNAQLNTKLVTNSVPTEAFTKGESGNEPKLPFLSLFPWGKIAGDKFQRPSTINKGLKRQAQRGKNGDGEDGEAIPLHFRPYVCKVPWHTGVRAFLSQLFPRYGHYCGPNWSSGKDGGSLVWDRRPIDWLDFCCYCHDIGYDTHDQAKMLKADLAFLECLEKQRGSTKGDPHVAHLYKTMSEKFSDTIQKEYSESTPFWATFDSVWVAKQFEMEKLELSENSWIELSCGE
ncbi:unnamed protein product [Sphenostylis stenocarpa]|uniref:Phospholipase A2 n=1 Tax=Sphenostylis stenocarpa TaxID=92480 RepID=A0AA86TFT4_9FABA|nr:unnamed protein product [Sphenostylis stenocarpa]